MKSSRILLALSVIFLAIKIYEFIFVFPFREPFIVMALAYLLASFARHHEMRAKFIRYCQTSIIVGAVCVVIS